MRNRLISGEPFCGEGCPVRQHNDISSAVLGGAVLGVARRGKAWAVISVLGF